jgi:hypothetical protein
VDDLRLMSQESRVKGHLVVIFIQGYFDAKIALNFGNRWVTIPIFSVHLVIHHFTLLLLKAIYLGLFSNDYKLSAAASSYRIATLNIIARLSIPRNVALTTFSLLFSPLTTAGSYSTLRAFVLVSVAILLPKFHFF